MFFKKYIKHIKSIMLIKNDNFNFIHVKFGTYTKTGRSDTRGGLRMYPFGGNAGTSSASMLGLGGNAGTSSASMLGLGGKAGAFLAAMSDFLGSNAGTLLAVLGFLGVSDCFSGKFLGGNSGAGGDIRTYKFVPELTGVLHFGNDIVI
jgi:hypothetical protein